jgi:hypothetical protein
VHILVARKDSEFPRNTKISAKKKKECTDNLAILTTEIIKAFKERNTVDLTLCPRMNANVVTGSKRRNIRVSSEIATVREPKGNSDGYFFENSKEYPKLVTELLRLQEKKCVQGVCYFINKIPKFIKKRESKCTKY